MLAPVAAFSCRPSPWCPAAGVHCYYHHQRKCILIITESWWWIIRYYPHDHYNACITLLWQVRGLLSRQLRSCPHCRQSLALLVLPAGLIYIQWSWDKCALNIGINVSSPHISWFTTDFLWVLAISLPRMSFGDIFGRLAGSRNGLLSKILASLLNHSGELKKRRTDNYLGVILSSSFTPSCPTH